MRATWKRLGTLASRVTQFRRRGKDRPRSPSPDGGPPEDDPQDRDRAGSVSSWRSSQEGDDDTGQVVNCEGILGVVRGEEILPRYFVLTDEKLKYYSEEGHYLQGDRARGFIPLNQVLNLDFTERGILVALKGQAEPLELVPNKIEEVEKWLLCFAQALEHVQADADQDLQSEAASDRGPDAPALKHSPTLFGAPRAEGGAGAALDKDQESADDAGDKSSEKGSASATEYKGPFQLLRSRLQRKDAKDSKDSKDPKKSQDSKTPKDSKSSKGGADSPGGQRGSAGDRPKSSHSPGGHRDSAGERPSGLAGVPSYPPDDDEDLPPLVGETPSQRLRTTTAVAAAAARAAAVARAQSSGAAEASVSQPAKPQTMVAAIRAAAEAAAAKASAATVGVVPSMMEEVAEDVDILQQGPLLSVLSATEDPNLRYFLLTTEALWYYDEFVHLEIGEAPRGAIELDRILQFEEGEQGFTFTLEHNGDLQLVQFQTIGDEDPRVWAANFRYLLQPRLQQDYETFWEFQDDESESESDPEEREILARGAAASSFRVWLQVELAEGLPLSNFHPNRYVVRAAWDHLPKTTCETYAVLGSQRLGRDTEECHLHQQLVLRAAAGKANVLVTLVMKQTPQDSVARASTARNAFRPVARRTEVGRPLETDLGTCILSPSDPASVDPQTYNLLDLDGQPTGAKIRARLRITAVPMSGGSHKDVRTYEFQVELPVGVDLEHLGARFLNLRGQGQKMGYMFTSLVTPGSWAELEGLQQGDELESVGGLKVGDMTREDFTRALESRPVMLSFSRKQGNQGPHDDSEVAPEPFWEVSGDGWDQHFYNFSSNHKANGEDVSLGSQQAKTQSMVSLSMKVQNLSYALLSVNPNAFQALRTAVKSSIAKIAGHGIQEQHVSVRVAPGMPAIVKATVAAAPPQRAIGVREKLSSNRVTLGKDLVASLLNMAEITSLAMGPLSVKSFLGRSEELTGREDGPTDVFSKLHNMHQEKTQERQRLKMIQTMKEDEVIERNKVGRKKKAGSTKKVSNPKAISDRLFYDSKLKGERQQILRAKHHFEEAQAVEETRTRPRLLESTLQSHEAALVAQAAGIRLHAMHRTHVETLRLKKVAADAKTYAEMDYNALSTQRERSRPVPETCHDVLFEDARERWERGQMAQEDEASKGLRTLEKADNNNKKKKVPDMGRVLQWQEQAKQRGELRRRMLLEKEAAIQRQLEQECAEQKELFLCPDYLRDIPPKVKTMSVSTPSTRRPQTSATTTATTTASRAESSSWRGKQAGEWPHSPHPSESRERRSEGDQKTPKTAAEEAAVRTAAPQQHPSAAESASLLRERGLSAQLPALPIGTTTSSPTAKAKAKGKAAAVATAAKEGQRQQSGGGVGGAGGKRRVAQSQQLQRPRASALEASPKVGGKKGTRTGTGTGTGTKGQTSHQHQQQPSRGRSLTARGRSSERNSHHQVGDPGQVINWRSTSGAAGTKKVDVAFGSSLKPERSETPSSKAAKAISGKVSHIMATLHTSVAQRCGVEVKDVSSSVARELATPLSKALEEFQNAAQASDQKGYGAQALRSRGSQRLWNDGFLFSYEDGKATCKQPDPIRQPDSDLQRLLEAGVMAQRYLEMKIGKSDGSGHPDGRKRFSQPSLTGALFAVSEGPKVEEEVEVESFVRYGQLGRTGRFQHILDYARLTVVFPDAASLEVALEEVLRLFDVVEVRNFYQSNTQGLLGNRYVQVHLVLTDRELGRGTHVAELLLRELCYHEAVSRSEAAISELAESLCFMYQQPGIGVSVLQHLVRWLLERPKEDHTLTIFRRNLARSYGSIAAAWRTLGIGSTIPFKTFRKLCEAVGCRQHVVGYWEALDAGRAGNISLFELDPDAVSLLARFLSALLAGYAEKAKCSMQDARTTSPEALMQWLLSKARRKPEKKQQMVASEWRSAAKSLGFSPEEGDRLFSYLLPDAHTEKRLVEAIGPDDLCYLAQIEQLVDLDAVFLRTVSGENGQEDNRSSLFVSTWAVLPSSAHPHLAVGTTKSEEKGPSHPGPAHPQSPTRALMSALPRELQWRQRVGESLAGAATSPKSPQKGDRLNTWLQDASKLRSDAAAANSPRNGAGQVGDTINYDDTEGNDEGKLEAQNEAEDGDKNTDEDKDERRDAEATESSNEGSPGRPEREQDQLLGSHDLSQFFETGKIPGVFSSESSLPIFPHAPGIFEDSDDILHEGDDEPRAEAASAAGFDSDLADFFESGVQARLEVIQKLDRHRRVDSPEATALRSVLQKEADARLEVLQQHGRPHSRDRSPNLGQHSNSPSRRASPSRRRGNGERPVETWKELFSGSDLEESDIY